ncbi:uncharacterized protein LOC144819416 [Lissotriton helveticus]
MAKEEGSQHFKDNLKSSIKDCVQKAISGFMLDISKNLEASLSKIFAFFKGSSFKSKKCLAPSESSRGISIKVGHPTREVSKSGPSSSPIVISHLRDTDDDDDVGMVDDSVILDGSNNLSIHGPSEKRCKTFPDDGGEFHPESNDLVDFLGDPMFNPSLIHHPNSTEWFPSDRVAEYVSFYLRYSLDKSTRNRLKLKCPRPSLPNNVNNTPAIDPNMLMFFTKFRKDPKKGVDRAWSNCKDRLLDLVGPLTRLFDLAEEVKMEGTTVDPNTLSNWAQWAICIFGDANAHISLERRKSLLLKMCPKLVYLASKE